MPTQPRPRPARQPDRDPDPRPSRDPLIDRYAWHPEPELIAYRSPDARDALRDLGAAAWDAALDFLYDHGVERALGDATPYTDQRRAYFGPSARPGPAPQNAAPAAEVIAAFRDRLAGRQMGSQHPRQFGYFTPPPLPMSMAAEMLTAMTQQGVDVWHAGPSAAFVEEEVVRWLCDLVGYGAGSFGILTSGGVMANVIGMTLARDLGLGRRLGQGRPPRGADLERARVYTSDQTHFSVARALDELGFPADTLVVLPADDAWRLRGDAVAAAVERDLAAGLTPFAIAAVLGSTNTGSVDAIGELADVAAAHDLWLHVDAAYGGAARLSERERHRVADLDRADSVTVDPHKWLFQAYDIGGLLVRDGRALAATFGGRSPEYYRGGEATAATGTEPINFYKLGIEGTRRWRALKLWMTWHHLGTDGLARLIEANLDLAAHLTARCVDADDFEVAMPEPDLSVVCFRHLPGGSARAATLAPDELDAHQDRLQRDLEVSGDGWLTTTRLRGATWLRAGIVNYLSTEADVDRLLDTLRALAGGATAPTP